MNRVAAVPVALAMVLVVPACGNDEASESPPTAAVAPPRSSTTTTAAATTTTTTTAAAVAIDDVTVGLHRIAKVAEPTALTAREGTEDLYVTERAGVVRRLARHGDDLDFDVDPEPVLDIVDAVVDHSGERGLLGLTFSPDGTHLFVSYTDGNDHGNSVIARFAMTGNTADPASRVEVLRLAQPYPNHNGGNIIFGPDGYLYAGYGDGGSQGDPHDNGQNTGVLLAKLLRLDVSRTDDTPYLVPADNPFVSAAGTGDRPPRGEVWSYGLRNPWRFSFDRANGDLWIGDVGGSAFEEIDYLPASDGAGRGANLGWSLREGAHDTDKDGDASGALDPIFEYDHSRGSSVVGGVVYRGSDIPSLIGTYLFADTYAGDLWGLRVRDGKLAEEGAMKAIGESGVSIQQAVSFGEDHAGEVYLVLLTGSILRIEPRD